MSVSSYRDLRVWQMSMEIVEATYRLTEAFPTSEIYSLTNQMRRAAISVASNIAEGHTREHTKEYLHHISMAQASLAELETQVEIALRLKYVHADQTSIFLQNSSSLGKQLYALRNALQKRC